MKPGPNNVAAGDADDFIPSLPSDAEVERVIRDYFDEKSTRGNPQEYTADVRRRLEGIAETSTQPIDTTAIREALRAVLAQRMIAVEMAEKGIPLPRREA
jgi:hypothetical protein